MRARFSVDRALPTRAAGILALMMAATAQADEQSIRKMFKVKIPDAQIVSVRKLPYAELYEVSLKRDGEGHVYYTDAQASFILIGGNLIETRTDRSLTEERLRQLSAIAWKDLPFRWAVTTRRGSVSR